MAGRVMEDDQNSVHGSINSKADSKDVMEKMLYASTKPAHTPTATAATKERILYDQLPLLVQSKSGTHSESSSSDTKLFNAANRFKEYKTLKTMQAQTERKVSIFDAVFRRLSTGANGQTYKSSSVSIAENGGRPATPRSKGFAHRFVAKEKESVMEEIDDDPKNDLICTISESPYYVYKACAQGLVDVVNVILSDNPKKAREPDPKGLTCLHHAAGRGRVEVIKLLLAKDVDINAKDDEGNTPLYTAIDKGQVEAVRALLSAGADGNILNANGYASIHIATIGNKPRVIEVLAQFPNLVDVNCRGVYGKRAIHWAGKYDYAECVEVLLKNGSRLCEPCDHGFYPIHVAAIRSSLDALEAMLKYGEMIGYTRECMLSYADKEANSPLHLAVNSGSYEVVRICLEQGARIDVRQESQATPFHFACSQGTMSIVRLMFEHHLKTRGESEGRVILLARDNAEMTPLHRAAMFDHVEVVKYLIEQGADIDAVDHEKCSPLLLAAARGATQSVAVLLEAGADVGLRDINKRHVLHFSVVYTQPRQKETMMSLVDNICQSQSGRLLLNMKDSFGCTPLHVASKEGNLKFAEALIKLGAIVNLKDNDDQSPLHFAARYGRYNTVRRLLESPAGPNILNETDARGMTALHVASQNGHTKVAQLLLEKGALIHKNFKGQTPLHLAVAHGYTQTMKMLLAFHSTLLDQKCKKGNTALHYACEENQAAAADILLSHGCAYSRNDEELAPMDIAVQRRNAEVATIIIQHERWKEALRMKSKIYGCPLMGMIQHLPDVHKVVLDRCYSKADMDQIARDYWIKYDFEYMQLPPAFVREFRKRNVSEYSYIKPLHTLNMMVRYGRVELLSHPVCLNFLQMKWRAYGIWFFLIHILFYSTFVGCLTTTIIQAHGNKSLPGENASAENVSDTGLHVKSVTNEITTACHIALIYLFGFCVANILKEIVQMYQQRLRYFLDYVNYIEWTMYITAIVFVTPALFCDTIDDTQWQCGSVAVFLAWFNLLLYLQRLDSVGLYVVMFLQILHTIMKVIIVFSVLFVAFGLAFYILLSATPNGSFRTPYVAILQAVMQLMGEYNYVDVYIRPFFTLDHAGPLQYAPLNFLFLVVFVVLMPILFVNLLIGLAVGDIEMVQRDAQLKRLAMQVEYHTELEEKLPLWLVEKVDKKELTIYPHRCGKSGLMSRIGEKVHSMCAEAMFQVGPVESTRRQNAQMDWSNDAIMEELENTKRRMKEIQTKTDTMHDLLRLIVQKMEIVTEADAYDEGRRQSDEDEERTHAGRKRALRLRAKVAPLMLGKSTQR